jgi:hypothetical protein
MATTLTSTLTVDDDFEIYVSTDDSVPGTLLGGGSTVSRGWENSYAFTAALTPGVTNYVHVKGWDLNGLIAGFVGEFLLSDASFKFGNGTQHLLTGSSTWQISDTGFGVGYYSPGDIARNGDAPAPWYVTIRGISGDAMWIWSHGGLYTDTPRYFSLPVFVTVGQVTLTTSTSAGGTVSAPGLGTFGYDSGTVVPVVAAPDLQYHFVNWTGTAVAAGKVADPASASTTVTMDNNYTLQANFATGQLTLIVTSTSGGTVSTPGVGAFSYAYGTVVPLEAVAYPGYVWAGWSGSLTSPSLIDSIEMIAPDLKVQANFTSLRDVLYVDDNAPGDPDPGCGGVLSDPIEDGSPEHPFDTIQKAIDVAGPGAKVIVREGTYCEQIDFLDKAITVTGFDPSEAQPNSYPVINGSGVGPVVRIAACCPVVCADNSGSSCAGTGPQPVLTGFVITGGVGYYASAIAVRNRSPLISHCVIVGNRSRLAGSGAIYCENSNLSLVNCTIAENVAGHQGAAIFGINSNPMLVNSIAWANVPAQMAFDDKSAPQISYMDVQGGWAGVGNIDTDPLFALAGYWASPADWTQPVDPRMAGAVWVPGDYHLVSKTGRWDAAQRSWVTDSATSPCIDAGDPQSPVLDEPAPNGNRVNLGAYGGTSQASKSGN